MLRRALPVLAVLTLIIPAALAATDPGRRSPDLATAAAVNDIVISDDGQRIGAGTADAGSTQLGQDPNQDTWYLWDQDGAVIQHGSGDRDACASTPPDICQSPITHLASSDSGDRIVALSRVARVTTSSDEAVLLFITANAGEVNRITLPGQPRGLAISAGGTSVAVLTENKPSTIGQDTESVVRQYNWGSVSAVTQVFTATLADPGSALAFSRDGARLVVATNPASGAGKIHWFAGSSTSTDATIVGARPQALAIAPAAPYWLLAGYNTGDLALFSDLSRSAPTHKLQYGGGATGVTALTMARSGLQGVAGYSDGVLRTFAIDPGLDRLTRLGSDPKPVAAAVQHLAYSGNGALLATATGTTVTLYSASNAGLVELWKDDVEATTTTLAIDHSGDLLAVGSTTKVIVFEAEHAIQGTLVGGAPTTVAPGSRQQVQVNFHNSGNRAETISLSLAFPSGWFAEAAPTSFDLGPGQSRLVDLSIAVPALAAPGVSGVYLNHSRGSARVDVNVPLVQDLVLDLPEGPGFNIGAGQSVPRSLLVANRGNRAETVRPLAQASNGWSSFVSPSELVIKPGEDGEFQLSLTAPAEARQGDSSTVTVTLPGFPSDPARATATVGASFAVQVSGASGITVRAGEEGTYEFSLRNAGNTLDSFDLALEGDVPAGWEVGFLSGGRITQIREIGAGQSEAVLLVFRAPTGPADDATWTATVKAASASDPGKIATKSVLVSVDGESSETSTSKSNGRGIAGPQPVLVALALLAVALALRRR